MHKSLFLAFLAVMFATVTSASGSQPLSLGSDMDSRYAEMSPGDIKTFQLSMLSTGDEELMVEIGVAHDGPLKVTAMPSEIMMTPDGDKDTQAWYLLGDGMTHRPIYRSSIMVEAPQSIEPGQFHDQKIRVSVRAVSAGSLKGEGIKENIRQQHEYEVDIRLTDEFFPTLKAPKEKIDLSYDRNDISSIQKGDVGEQGKDRADIEYINFSRNMLYVGDESQVDGTKDIYTGQDGDPGIQEHGSLDIYVLVACISAILIVIFS